MNMVFVFGSNLSGHHGMGAARTARIEHGAQMGVGVGPTGSSYAIPTKDHSIRFTLSLLAIQSHVRRFLEYASKHQAQQFRVTCIGCGLAGLKHSQIAPMFANAPSNCFFDTAWKPWLGDVSNYWGTYP